MNDLQILSLLVIIFFLFVQFMIVGWKMIAYERADVGGIAAILMLLALGALAVAQLL